MGFGFDEKVLAILHGLSVFEDKMYLLIVFCAVRVWYRCTFCCICQYFPFRVWGKGKTEKQKKNGYMGFKEFSRSLVY